MEPQQGGEKTYTLLREARRKTNKLGVATFVMRDKDVFNEQLRAIIEAKSAGKKSKVIQLDNKPTPAKELMAQLRASLAKKKKEQAA